MPHLNPYLHHPPKHSHITMIKVGLGQDSHRFDLDNPSKPLVLAGIEIKDGTPGLLGNSDADVVLHALTNAISGVSGTNILGKVSDELCQQGHTNSSVYLKHALHSLRNLEVQHVSVSLECQRPKISPHIGAMKQNLAHLLSLRLTDIGITATSGEGLTAFGRGEGIQALVIVTVGNRID